MSPILVAAVKHLPLAEFKSVRKPTFRLYFSTHLRKYCIRTYNDGCKINETGKMKG